MHFVHVTGSGRASNPVRDMARVDEAAVPRLPRSVAMPFFAYT
jgi:hypothetical protein